MTMKFLRCNTSLVWVFVTLFVTQLFVPLALATALPEKGGVGIVICTTTGLKQLKPNGDLVPVGDNTAPQTGQNGCLICLTSGLTDKADTTPSPASLAPRTAFGEQDYCPDRRNIPLDLSNHGFKARAPPVTV